MEKQGNNMAKLKTGFIQIDIAKLVKADWNYKEEDAEMSAKLEENLKKNGQIENIIIADNGDGTFEVVNGNHRLDLFLKLGINEPMCCNLGTIPIEERKRIAVETNETKFQNNTVRLSELLIEISQKYPQEDLEASLPFKKAELEALLNIGNFDFNQYQSGEDETFNANEEYIEVKFKVAKSVYENWQQLIKKLSSSIPNITESRAFEFAVTEAINIPDESIS